MLCNNCNLRSICKIFDTLNNPGITANITSCNYIKSNSVNNNTIQEPIKHEIKERKSRAYQDITELSNKIKAEKEQKEAKKIKKPKVNILENTAETDCPNCNTKTSSTYNCPTCQKEMCLLCAMTSIDIKGNVVHLCEECWANDEELKQESIIDSNTVELTEEIEKIDTKDDTTVKKERKTKSVSEKYKRSNKKF